MRNKKLLLALAALALPALALAAPPGIPAFVSTPAGGGATAYSLPVQTLLLMTALSFNPSLIGLGIDEDTAAFIDGDDVLEVVGGGGVTVLDPSAVTHSSMAAAHKGGAVGFFGLKLNVLVSGDRFDLRQRTPVLG